MKKFLILAGFAAALSLVSCNRNDDYQVIRFEKTELELVKGEEIQLNPVFIPEISNPEVEWRSSNPEYVTVSSTGLVKAVGLYYKNPTDTDTYPVSIYCSCGTGAAECKITVLPLPLKSLKLEIPDWTEGSILTLDPKETRKVTLVPEPADADFDPADIEWESDYFLYASVTPNPENNMEATIEAIWPGSIQISATYARVSATVSCYVTTIPATSVQIDEVGDEITLANGDQRQLSATFAPETATVSVEWTTTDSNIATVSPEGLVTAKAPGRAVIKATVAAASGVLSDQVTIVVE